jgi:hypothetical protein
VSSTVRDFAPVRRDLAEWLRARGVDVRESEDPEFPVDPGLHSAEACLRAIEGCHVYILLIGWRYGGLYRGTPQSITWREYDEARRLGIPVIAFVLSEVAAEAARATAAKRNLGTLDPGIVRFVETIKRQRRDNWVHLEWDGSLTYLKQAIDSRWNALFVAYQRPHWKLEREARRLEPYVEARAAMDALAGRARGLDAAGRRAVIENLLDVDVEYREPLFDFRDEKWNFVVHRREGKALKVFARRAHPGITLRNLAWPLGQGHVGKAAEQPDTIFISGNLEHTADWHSEFSTDLDNYRSAVCIAIGGTRATGVLTVTSNRLEHFHDLQQVEVLTARSLARMIDFTGALDR